MTGESDHLDDTGSTDDLVDVTGTGPGKASEPARHAGSLPVGEHRAPRHAGAHAATGEPDHAAEHAGARHAPEPAESAAPEPVDPSEDPEPVEPAGATRSPEVVDSPKTGESTAVLPADEQTPIRPGSATLSMLGASVRQGRDTLLPTSTVAVPAGQVVVVVGDPGAQLSAFALALAGRLRLDTGQVTWDGREDRAVLQRSVALVDVPEVSEPERGVPVRTVVAEELAFAGRRTSGRRAVEWLTSVGLEKWSRSRIEEVPARQRVEMLVELAALRPGITHLVIGHPERHGGAPAQWIEIAQRHAANGLGVVLTVSHATANEHEASYVLGTEDNRTEGEGR